MKSVFFCAFILLLFACTTVDSQTDNIIIPEIESDLVNDNDAVNEREVVIPDTALADEIDPKKNQTDDQKDYAGKKPGRDDESFDDIVPTDELPEQSFDHSADDISTYIQNDYIYRLQAPVNKPAVPAEAPLVVLPPLQEDVAAESNPRAEKQVPPQQDIATVKPPSPAPPENHSQQQSPNQAAHSPAQSVLRPEPPSENLAALSNPIRISETREAGYNPDNKKVQIELDGLGWYLVKPPSDGLRFQDLYPGNGKTLIVFLVSEDGRYILQLARQNFETGEEEERAIQLVVAPEVKELPVVVETSSSSETPIAASSEENETDDLPLSLINEPARLTPEVDDDELKRLLMNAVALKRPLAAIEILNKLEADQDLDADVLFLLGQYYDIQGPGKDMEKAYLYYGRLVNDFPLHEKWNEAVRRYRYLKNRFFG